MKVSIGPYPDDGNDRDVNVHIDNYDTWSMDSTLAYIIIPMLKQLRDSAHTSAQVDNQDLPVHLRHDNNPRNETGQYDLFADEEYDDQVGDTYVPRWNYILDEMIWAFEQVNTDWESQFSSGVHDMFSKPVDAEGNEVPEDQAEFFELCKGPNATYEIDWDRRQAYSDRMQNGYLMFGKYFQALWD